MGNNCCSDHRANWDINREFMTNKSSKTKGFKRTDMKPVGRAAKGCADTFTEASEQIKNSRSADAQASNLPCHGNMSKEIIKRQTRVVKQGKKIRRYNYKRINLTNEDMNFYLDPTVRRIYQEEGEYNYEELLQNGIIDKTMLREFCDTSIMVDGSKYKGQFKKRRLIKDGIGQIIYKDGSLFEGAFINDDTVYGRFIFTHGYVYEGQMKSHRMHGLGQLKYEDTVVYEGEFEDGIQCGEATIITDTADLSTGSKSTDDSTPTKIVQFDMSKKKVIE